jgi:hypothetical protein
MTFRGGLAIQSAMDTTTESLRESSAPPELAAFAYTGFAGIGAFVLSTFALLVAEPERNALSEPFSYYYVHGHHGWLLTFGLIALGLGSLALSVGVAQCVTDRIGTRGLAIFGIAVIVAGLFPADPWWPWERIPSVVAVVHGTAALIGMSIFAATAIPLMRALRAEARWDRIGIFFVLTAAAGVVGLAGCILSTTAKWPPQFLGLAERVAIGAGVAWLALIATGLLYAPVLSSRRK